jgi:arsenate reductase (thioredoxin)
MSNTVLFLCPHNIAKSVIAAAYFDRLAQQAALPFTAESAGTEPENEMMTTVVTLLASEGIDVSSHQPRLVTDAELASTTYIVSMNCEIDALVPSGVPLERWDDIPPVSQNAALSASIIRQRVAQLVARLQAEDTATRSGTHS